MFLYPRVFRLLFGIAMKYEKGYEKVSQLFNSIWDYGSLPLKPMKKMPVFTVFSSGITKIISEFNPNFTFLSYLGSLSAKYRHRCLKDRHQ